MIDRINVLVLAVALGSCSAEHPNQTGGSWGDDYNYNVNYDRGGCPSQDEEPLARAGGQVLEVVSSEAGGNYLLGATVQMGIVEYDVLSIRYQARGVQYELHYEVRTADEGT